METKICSKCKQEKSVGEFNKKLDTKDGLRSDCRECRKQYRQENPEKIKNAELKRKYGITLEQCNAMAEEQGNACVICEQQKKLVVDHCHNTGIVRGLLCNDCNAAIGLLKETPEYFDNAKQYLEAYNSINKERMLG